MAAPGIPGFITERDSFGLGSAVDGNGPGASFIV